MRIYEFEVSIVTKTGPMEITYMVLGDSIPDAVEVFEGNSPRFYGAIEPPLIISIKATTKNVIMRSQA